MLAIIAFLGVHLLTTSLICIALGFGCIAYGEGRRESDAQYSDGGLTIPGLVLCLIGIVLIAIRMIQIVHGHP